MSDSPAGDPGSPARPDVPTFAELAADPEVAALLKFQAVPRKRASEDSWTPELQREFIARLARHGSANRACTEMGKNRTGMTRLCNSPGAKTFVAAWDGAVALAKRRRAERAAGERGRSGTTPPTLDTRRKYDPSPYAPARRGLPGQMLNEYGEWEDAESVHRRGQEAGKSIARKLIRIRRMYLKEISGNAGKRAAFEILTELPVDWAIAAAGGAQPDEPLRTANQRQPDMVLTAESGWSFGELGYGPDRKAEARAAVDAHRAGLGLGPVDWDADDSEDWEEEEGAR